MGEAANLQLSEEEMRLVTDPGWILTKNSIIRKTVELMARVSEEYVGIWGEVFQGGGGAAGDAAGVRGTTGDAAGMRATTGDAGGMRGTTGDAAGERRTTGDAAGVRGTAGGLREFETGSPKISRGENYRGLPWVMLDYPRAFGREDVLAIRTMFWWGHGFNVTLHLKGRWMEMCLPVIFGRRRELAAAGFHIGISEDEWRLEHGPENYRAFGEMDAHAAGDVRAAGDVHATGDAIPEIMALTGGRDFLKLSAAVGLDRWTEAPTILKTLFGVLVDILGEVKD